MKYQINFAETKNYYNSQPCFCSCEYCRNFRKMLPKYHPEVIEILSSFGLDFCREFEIISYGCNPETPNIRLYEGLYAVFGKLFEDNLVFYDKDEVKITLLKSESAGGLVPKTDEQFFMLTLSLSLPWIIPNE